LINVSVNPLRCIPAMEDEDDVRTLWVGDVETWMDEAYLCCAFAVCGHITNVKLVRTNRGIGYAFMEFSSSLEVQQFLKRLNGRTFQAHDGRSLRVNRASYGFSSSTNAGSSENSVYVGNLDISVRDAQLFKFFASKYSSVTAARVLVDGHSGMSKGFGFVRFREASDAEHAIAHLQGAFLGSRPIKVRPSLRQSQANATPLVPFSTDAQVSRMVCTLIIGNLDMASFQDDANQLAVFCAAFGNVLQAYFAEGYAYVEFSDLASAQQASVFFGGAQLPVELVDANGQRLATLTPTTPALTNRTTQKAEMQLKEQMKPGIEHFKALLQEPHFVSAFESVLATDAPQGYLSPEQMMGSFLLKDRSDFWNRDELNNDFLEAFGGLGRTFHRVPAQLPHEMQALLF
jgi:hypothetical protein